MSISSISPVSQSILTQPAPAPATGAQAANFQQALAGAGGNSSSSAAAQASGSQPAAKPHHGHHHGGGGGGASNSSSSQASTLLSTLSGMASASVNISV